MRYRVSVPVPGMPRRAIDIAFTKAKIAVFMDGCFWHGCPEHATQPKTNAEWWRAKLDRNMARDVETTDHLKAEGWTVLRFWEHESPSTLPTGSPLASPRLGVSPAHREADDFFVPNAIGPYVTSARGD